MTQKPSTNILGSCLVDESSTDFRDIVRSPSLLLFFFPFGNRISSMEISDDRQPYRTRVFVANESLNGTTRLRDHRRSSLTETNRRTSRCALVSLPPG